MQTTYYKKDKHLVFEIEEEIDECSVQNLKRRMDNEIQRYMPKEVIFDFSNVSFMDSAGIGLIIGRYKTVLSYGGTLEVRNVSEKLRKILEMSGIHKIINIKTVA